MLFFQHFNVHQDFVVRQLEFAYFLLHQWVFMGVNQLVQLEKFVFESYKLQLKIGPRTLKKRDSLRRFLLPGLLEGFGVLSLDFKAFTSFPFLFVC